MEISVQTFDKICRVCLIETASMQSIFTKLDGENRSLIDILEFTANISIKTEDNLPKQVCCECQTMMCKADAFKRRCIESETILNRLSQAANYLAETSKDAKEFSIKHEHSDTKQKLSNYDNFQALSESNYSNHDNFDSKNLLTQNQGLFSTLDASFGAEVPKNYVKEEALNNFEDEMDYSDHYHESGIVETIAIEFKQESDEKSYTCDCGEVFNSNNMYKTHLKQKSCSKFKKVLQKSIKKKQAMPKTAPKTEFLCNICNRKLMSMYTLKLHQKVCANAVPISELYECKYCLGRFKNKDAFNNHVKKHEEEDAVLHQCSFCLRKFKNKASLTAHLQRHEETDNIKHVCEVCKREFKYKAYLENHILTMHSGKNGINCDECAQSLPDEKSLEIHKESHKNEKKHRCSICNKGFLMACTLKEHMRTHTGEKPFLCSQCGKGFSQKTNLAQHMRRHQGLKPFKCENCEKRFVSKGELDAHNRKHSGAHPFICSDCGNGFTTSSALVKHRRTHTGEKPYLCDLCPMRFAASGTLKNHRRTHTGERPFQCSHCEKAFVQRNDLISHIRCHTGEKPYICNQCGQSFRKASGLKTHVKMHGKESMLQGVMLHGLQVRE